MKQNEYLDKFMAQFPFEGLTYDDVSLVLQYADFLPDTQITCLYQLGKAGRLGGYFARDSISNERCDMGRGCGDLNGDGRNDILTPPAWYENCADGTWKRHPLRVGFEDGGRELGHASNFIVFDVNKDGLNARHRRDLDAGALPRLGRHRRGRRAGTRRGQALHGAQRRRPR